MPEGERSGRFVTFRALPGSARPAWCFLLPPEWRALSRRPLAEIAAEQWRVANSVLLNDLGGMRRDDSTTVSYAELCCNPAAEVQRLCVFMDVRPDGFVRLDVEDWSQPTLQERRAIIYAAKSEIEALTELVEVLERG